MKITLEDFNTCFGILRKHTLNDILTDESMRAGGAMEDLFLYDADDFVLGEILKQDQSKNPSPPPFYVWTLCDEGDELYLNRGITRVNRLGYLLTRQTPTNTQDTIEIVEEHEVND
jgi:hypothetical protein